MQIQNLELPIDLSHSIQIACKSTYRQKSGGKIKNNRQALIKPTLAAYCQVFRRK